MTCFSLSESVESLLFVLSVLEFQGDGSDFIPCVGYLMALQCFLDFVGNFLSWVVPLSRL